VGELRYERESDFRAEIGGGMHEEDGPHHQVIGGQLFRRILLVITDSADVWNGSPSWCLPSLSLSLFHLLCPPLCFTLSLSLSPPPPHTLTLS
jgi:hypothetical protein